MENGGWKMDDGRALNYDQRIGFGVVFYSGYLFK